MDRIPQHAGYKGLAKDIHRLQSMNYVLADPELHKDTQISLLIGGDHYYDLVHPGYIREGTLFLIPTICGYALAGTHKNKTENAQVEVISILKLAVTPQEERLCNPEYQAPKEDLNKLWELDHIGILLDEKTQETLDTVKQFKESIT